MNNEIVDTLAAKYGISPLDMKNIIGDLMLLIHKEFYECTDDVIGVPMYCNLGEQGYFHFLGIIESFVRRYAPWEPGYAQEYIGRLSGRDDWQYYADQMNGWVKRPW